MRMFVEIDHIETMATLGLIVSTISYLRPCILSCPMSKLHLRVASCYHENWATKVGEHNIFPPVPATCKRTVFICPIYCSAKLKLWRQRHFRIWGINLCLEMRRWVSIFEHLIIIESVDLPVPPLIMWKSCFATIATLITSTTVAMSSYLTVFHGVMEELMLGQWM